ncbi:MAG: NADH-quinone oxidoreductase subunit H, partial [bacterium]|nr:NADH-quinone oxidoreductase subunit H [bacterium]
FVVSSIAVVLYLGGFYLPFESHIVWIAGLSDLSRGLVHFVVFLTKVWFLIFMMIWIRWTLPRYRIDQLMDLCWKGLIPLALMNFVGTACWMALGR